MWRQRKEGGNNCCCTFCSYSGKYSALVLPVIDFAGRGKQRARSEMDEMLIRDL
jgi:hypothetical protein